VSALRRAQLCVAILFATSLAFGCVSIVGVSESDYLNAVEELCKCRPLGFAYGSTVTCVSTLSARLSVASEATRAAWLDNYVKKCQLCGDVTSVECLRTPPTCVDTGNQCSKSEECCTLGNLCKGGICEN
jgi:hypothetical protein